MNFGASVEIKNIRMAFLVGGIAAATLTIGTFLLYVFGGHFTGGLSDKASDWGLFGDYFGGVLGTLFGGVSFVMLMGTLLLQEDQISTLAKQSLQQNHLNSMNIIYADIQYLLSRKLWIARKEVEFGQVVVGDVGGQPTDPHAFRGMVFRLLEHVFEYTAAVRSYKANLDDEHIIQYKTHRNRVRRWTKFIAQHSTKFTAEQMPLFEALMQIADKDPDYF
jgi:hypothetical protein